MRERERHHDDERPPTGTTPATGTSGGAAALERAQRLQEHGQALIDCVLSGDSERYLGSIRQRGGE